MQPVSCDINTTDKVHRILIGSLLIIGALFDLGRGFMVTIGLIVLVEGILGKCGIPLLVAKYHDLMAKR